MITATASFIVSQGGPRPFQQNAVSISTSASSDDAAAAKQEKASTALDALRSMVEDAPRERKAQAEEKLKRLKEEMTSLMRWGFAPGVTAQRSLQLAKELGATALQFADAVSADKTMRSSFPSPDIFTNETKPDAAPEQRQSVVPRAYLDVINSDPDSMAQISNDADTAVSFRDAASHLRFILDDSARKLREQWRPAAFTETADKDFERIDQALSKIDGNAFSATPGFGSAPTLLFL